MALLSLAIQPTLLTGGAPLAYAWGLHQTLFALALVLHGWRFELIAPLAAPVLAMAVALVLSAAFGALPAELGPGAMLGAFALLALPFALSHQRLPQPSARLVEQLLPLLPLLSVAFGLLIQAGGGHAAYHGFGDRLEGATGNPATFAMLAFAGLVAATRGFARGRSSMGPAAALNLALLLMSGSRTALVASTLFLISYALASPALRAGVLRLRRTLSIALVIVAGALALALPTLIHRTLMPSRISAFDFDALRRVDTWSFYLEAWLQSPLFGRGFGSGFVLAPPWFGMPAAPHNAYLHLLLSGGLIGGGLCLLAIVVWYREVLRRARSDDRAFLGSLALALAAYALADNVLAYFTSLALFLYLAVVTDPPDPSASRSGGPSGGLGAGSRPWLAVRQRDVRRRGRRAAPRRGRERRRGGHHG